MQIEDCTLKDEPSLHSGPAGAVPLPRAAVTALAASAWFLGLYCLTNWLASLRADVGGWQFAFERRIPFVRWMIVPYLSLDVLFVLSFFLCTTRGELRTHLRRIVAVNVIAGVCFVLFPLRMVPPRPTDLSGVLGPLFRLLYSLDRPYNLCPSLHIAQGLLVWLVFRRHARGTVRILVHAWFLTIGVSTLLTWQHGVPDVITGAILGVLCWRMFPQAQVTGAAPARAPARGKRQPSMPEDLRRADS